MVFATGLGAPETPRLLPDRSWLVVEMAAACGCVTHISEDGREVRRIARTGRPNGLVVDRDGIIWVAETHPEPGLLRVTMDGDVDQYLDACEGEPFLFPNDLCFGPDGALYMTDSGIRFENWLVDGAVRPDYASTTYDGRVYRVDLRERSVTRLDSDLKFTNGIAIGPDGHLYANEMITGRVYQYALRDGVPIGERREFGNVLAPEWVGGFRGPDGMAFGSDGHLYCTVYGQGDVTILDRVGEVIRRIPTMGRQPTNLAFGPDRQQKIYVTEVEHGCIEVHDVTTGGLPLHDGR
jgi:gluconolactonase